MKMASANEDEHVDVDGLSESGSGYESDDSDVEVEVDEEDNENHVRGVQTKSVSAAGGWRRKVGLGAPKKRTSHHNEAERSRRGELTNSYRRLHDRLKKYEPEKNKMPKDTILATASSTIQLLHQRIDSLNKCTDLLENFLKEREEHQKTCQECQLLQESCSCSHNNNNGDFGSHSSGLNSNNNSSGSSSNNNSSGGGTSNSSGGNTRSSRSNNSGSRSNSSKSNTSSRKRRRVE